MILFSFLFSGGEEAVALVGVTTVSPVGTEGEGEATGEEGALEAEGDTIMVGPPAMAPVTGGTECGWSRERMYFYGDILQELLTL